VKTVHVLSLVHKEWSSQGYLFAFLSPQQYYRTALLTALHFKDKMSFSPKFISCSVILLAIASEASAVTLRRACILIITAQDFSMIFVTKIPFPRGSNELVFVLVLKRLYLVLRLKQQRVHGAITVKSFCAALATEIASHHDARIHRRLGQASAEVNIVVSVIS
jgi:hypothetical protein